MRSVPERVIEAIHAAVRNGLDLFADRDHRVDEAVELELRFAFGRLDHQRTADREAHRRGMEAIIHESLGHIVDADLARLLERAQVEDAFVGDQAARARIEDRIVRRESPGEVVGRQDGGLGRGPQTVASHHRDVHPGDREDAGAAVGCCGNGSDPPHIRRARFVGCVARASLYYLYYLVARSLPPRAHRRLCGGRCFGQVSVSRKKLGQVGADRDRAHARSAAAVRNAERLVQVEVRDVRTELAGRGEPDERVQVGTVDIDLATALVHDVADITDPRFEHAVGRGVRDHDRGELVAVRLGLGPKVGKIDVALAVAGHDDHAHAGHLRRRRVRAVRRGGNQANVAARFAAARVIGADDEQSRVFALRPGVRLQRYRGVAGDGAQHALELGDHLPIAFGLIGGRERVHVRELGPGHRDHFCDRVQLHRARTEWDHRPVECDVAVGQPPQIAHHLGFRMIAIERRVREERGAPAQYRGKRVFDAVFEYGEVGRRCARRGEELP